MNRSLDPLLSNQTAFNAPSLYRAWPVIVAYCFLWTLVQWVSEPNLDSYYDMLENYGWSQAMAWGTFKHPPFFAWVVGAWFKVFPISDLSYKALAYANVAVALAGVVALARQLGLARFSHAAVFLLLLSFPYTTLAAKFNANAQLLSLWPWTAVIFLHALSAQGGRALLMAVALGALSAACMLSKYYSGVFLLSLLVVAVLQREGRQWLLTPWPYLALTVFAAGIYPHYQWLAAHDFATFVYASEQSDASILWLRILKFFFMPLLYVFPAWLASAALFAWATPSAQGARFVQFGKNLLLALRPHGWSDALFWFSWVPVVTTVLFGVCDVVTPEAPWAIPLGFAFSLMWLRNLSVQSSPDSAVDQVLKRLHIWSIKGLGVLAVLGLALTVYWANEGHEEYYRPIEIAGHNIASDWQKRHPDVPLQWSAGDWGLNAMVGFYADPKIQALPNLPDSWEASVSPVANWQSKGGVIVCDLGKGHPTEAQLLTNACVQKTITWLQERKQDTKPIVYDLSRRGWRFPKQLSFGYAVFHYVP